MVNICLSVPIYSYFSLDELFSFAKQAGFDGVEYLASLKDWVKKPQHIVDLSEKYNVPVLSIHQPIWSIFYSPSFLIPHMVSLAQDFPSVKITNQHLSAFLNPLGSNINGAMQFIESAKEKNIQVSYESNPGRFYLSKRYPKATYEFTAFEEYAKQHSLPMTMDTSHIANVGGDIVAFFRRNHKQIKLIHLSDYKDGIEHLPLGTGKLPLKEFLQEIKKAKWNGQITFEIGTIKHFKTKKEKFAALQSSLDFVRKQV